jgi:hypothetical protein
MFYDVESRKLIAQERAALLQAEAQNGSGDQRARRWLSDHLISAGERLAPSGCQPRRRPARAV